MDGQRESCLLSLDSTRALAIPHTLGLNKEPYSRYLNLNADLGGAYRELR